MVSKKTKTGYAIEVSGQYHSLNRENGVKSPRVYKPQKFIFPEFVLYKHGMKTKTIEQEDGATREVSVPNIVKAHILNVSLSVIKNFYIVPRLKDEYPDFNGLRTCAIFSKEEIEIDDATAQSVIDKPIKAMTESDLLQYVTIRDIPVTLSSFVDLADKKAAVEQAEMQQKIDNEIAGKAKPLTEEEKLLQKPSLLS